MLCVEKCLAHVPSCSNHQTDKPLHAYYTRSAEQFARFILARDLGQLTVATADTSNVSCSILLQQARHGENTAADSTQDKSSTGAAPHPPGIALELKQYRSAQAERLSKIEKLKKSFSFHWSTSTRISYDTSTHYALRVLVLVL